MNFNPVTPNVDPCFHACLFARLSSPGSPLQHTLAPSAYVQLSPASVYFHLLVCVPPTLSLCLTCFSKLITLLFSPLLYHQTCLFFPFQFLLYFITNRSFPLLLFFPLSVIPYHTYYTLPFICFSSYCAVLKTYY